MPRRDPFYNPWKDLRKILLKLILAFTIVAVYVLCSSCMSKRPICDNNIEIQYEENQEQKDSAKIDKQQESVSILEVFSHGSTSSDSTSVSDKTKTEEESHEHIEMYFDSIGNLQKVVADLKNRLKQQNDYKVSHNSETQSLENKLTAKDIEITLLKAELNHYIALHQNDSIRLANKETPLLSENDQFFIRCGKIAVFLFCAIFFCIGFFIFIKSRS